MRTIAREVLAQLGGDHFIGLAGARNLIDCGDGLMFSFPKESKSARKCRIRFEEGYESYRVEFFQGRGLDLRMTASYPSVPYEGLEKLFSAQTGLTMPWNELPLTSQALKDAQALDA